MQINYTFATDGWFIACLSRQETGEFTLNYSFFVSGLQVQQQYFGHSSRILELVVRAGHEA
mgnify:CR=1 FL=1